MNWKTMIFQKQQQKNGNRVFVHFFGVGKVLSEKEIFVEELNFFSKDSIILYVIKVHHNNRKNILKLINHPDNKHIKVIKLNTKTNVNEFINEI